MYCLLLIVVSPIFCTLKQTNFRIIKAKIGDCDKIGDAWKNIFNASSTKIITDLGLAVDKFYKNGEYDEKLTPIHMAACSGNLQLLISILEK